MTSLHFDLLALIQSMHAVGLMPDDAYQSERSRLLSIIAEKPWKSALFDLEHWRGHPDVGRREGFASEVYYGDRPPIQQSNFDWKIIAADFLQAAFRPELQDEIESELRHLGIEAVNPQTTLSRLLRDYKYQKNVISMLRENLNTLHEEVSVLKQQALRSDEIAKLREELRNLRSTMRELTGYNQQGGGAPDRAIDQKEIERLEEKLADCHRAEASCRRRGDEYGASRWQGEAAKLNVRLLRLR